MSSRVAEAVTGDGEGEGADPGGVALAAQPATRIAAVRTPRGLSRMGIARTSGCREDGTDVRLVAPLLPGRGYSLRRGYSPITDQRKPIMMKKPTKRAIRPIPP